MDVETFHERSCTISLEHVNGTFKEASVSDDQGYGIRVYHNNKLGFAFCQNPKDIAKTTNHAKIAASFSEELDFSFASQKPPSKKLPSPVRSFDERELHSILKDVESGIRTKTNTMRVIVQKTDQDVGVMNPSFESEYSQSALSIYAEALCDGGSSHDHYHGTKPPESAFEFGKYLAIRAFDMKSAKKPTQSTYHATVFGIRALEGLIELFSHSLHADRIRKGISPFSEKLPVLSKEFTLYENPLLKKGVPRPFDDEGMPSQIRPLIKDGKLYSILMDRTEAARSKKSFDLSGACSRGSYDSFPKIGSTYFEIPQGTYRSFEEEFGTNPTLYIESIHGLHTANATTGDFGVEVNEAYELVKGTKRPVRGFLVGDNIYKLLSDKLLAFERGSLLYGSLDAPRMACRDVRVVL